MQYLEWIGTRVKHTHLKRKVSDVDMFNIRDEGEYLKQGINIYPRTSKSSRGCIIRIGNLMFRCRYSIPQGKWILSIDRISN
jgi:hypothetical protein